MLNSSLRHREWVNVMVGSTGIRAFIVYPWRADKAPVVMVLEHRQSASPWVRAAADQIAAEGFIAVVPDLLSGAAPNGGDSDSFANRKAIASALGRMGDEYRAARRFRELMGFSLPSSNGKSATIELDFHNNQMNATSAGRAASFELDQKAWTQAVAFLNREADNRPVFGVNPNANMPGDHSAHIAMAMAQTPPQNKEAAPAGVTRLGNLPELHGHVHRQNALANSTLRANTSTFPWAA